MTDANSDHSYGVGEWQMAGSKSKRKLTREQREIKRKSDEAHAKTMEAYYQSQGFMKNHKEDPKQDTIVLNKSDKSRGSKNPQSQTNINEEDVTKVKFVSFSQKHKLVQLRERKGLTQRQAAQTVEVTHNIYESYESGKAVFDNTIYTKILTGLSRLPDKVERKDDN